MQSLVDGQGWVPHFTSIINWTLQIGLALLNQVGPIVDPWIAIMDHSIDVGVKKVLVVLRVKLDTLKLKGKALALSDCECIGVRITEKSNGETVANDLKAIFNQSGMPAAIIKDGGSDLSRGVAVWRHENKQSQVQVIDDIGHVVANALKSQFAKCPLFLLFLAIINSCAKRLRQTKLAFLAPPKLRSKGRFQAISKLANWASKAMEVLNQTQHHPDFAKLRLSLSRLPKLKKFILNLTQNTQKSSEIMEVLKNRGLNQETFKEVKALLKMLPKRSQVKKTISKWLNKHLLIHAQMNLGTTPLAVSSDIIESLFGKFKSIINRGSMMDMNRCILLLPALCGNLQHNRIEKILGLVSIQDLKTWEKTNVAYTQNKLRRHFLKNKSIHTGPKTGDLQMPSG